MSYLSLYRKWRPRTFDDVRGQEAVVTTLKNQVKHDRTGHAYIFIGTRGTGKTSVAKIMAAALNCEDLKDGNPCCECPSCKRIISGEAMNVKEIDAASNTGVDSVRELREDILYPPADGRKKVYIIDEVHMLSTAAFNALLKTLEEPPEYVTFILATTETSKIPLTIFSRCQRYDFHRISVEEIDAQIKRLAKEGGFEIKDKASNYLAKKADGAMRDALSLLDRCLSYTGSEKITYDKVLSAIGAVDIDIFSEMFRALTEGDTISCIKKLDEVINEGGVLSTFITDLTAYMRNLLLLTAAPDMDVSDILEATEENTARMKEDAAITDAATITMYIRAMSELLADLRNSTAQRTTAEVAFIKLTRPAIKEPEAFAASEKRIQGLERQLSEAMEALNGFREQVQSGKIHLAKVNAGPSGAQHLPEEDIGAEFQDRLKYEDLPKDMKGLVDRWSIIMDEFSTPSLVPGLLEHSKITAKDGHTLEIVVESQTYFDNLNAASGEGNTTNVQALREFISVLLGDMDVNVIVTKIDKGRLGSVKGLEEMVHIEILPDDRKDDV